MSPCPGAKSRAQPSGAAGRRALRASDKLSDERLGEPSASIRARVEQARAAQRTRFAETGLTCVRPQVASTWSRRRCGRFAPWTRRVRPCCVRRWSARGVHGMRMSARAYHRILKLARTIADMARADGIEAPHLASATGRSDPVPAAEDGIGPPHRIISS